MRNLFAVIIASSFFLFGCSLPENSWIYPEPVSKSTKNYDIQASIYCYNMLGSNTCQQFVIKLNNKSNSTMKIVWNDSAVVYGGKSSALLPEGVRYIERDASKQDTIVPQGSEISVSVTPNSNIFYSDAQKAWDVYLLMPYTYKLAITLDVNGKKVTETLELTVIDTRK